MRNKIIVKRGKSLTETEIKTIHKILQKAFPGNEPIRSKNKQLFSKDVFFILYSPKKEILSVARLRPRKIKFRNQSYSIQGIADVVSVIKGKGYGKAIMKRMHKYLKLKKQMGIGFCAKKNAPFYEKCGFKVSKNLVKRFIYQTPKGKIEDQGDQDVVYSVDSKAFIKKLSKHPKEEVILSCPHW